LREYLKLNPSEDISVIITHCIEREKEILREQLKRQFDQQISNIEAKNNQLMTAIL